MNEDSSMDFYETKAPKKKSGGTTFIIILLLLIIIGMGGYIAYDKGYLDSIIKKDTKTEQKAEEKPEEKDTTPEVKEITDQTVIKTLDRNVEILNLQAEATWIDKSVVFAKDQKNTDIKEDYKMLSVVMYLNGYSLPPLQHGSTSKKATAEQFKNVCTKLYDGKCPVTDFEDMAEEAYANSESEVDTLFKSVYGYIPNHDLTYGSGTPTIAYDSQTKTYVASFGGGGTCGEQSLTYNYKYEEDDKNAYVYTSVGIDVCSEGIYKDYDQKELFKKTEGTGGADFKIDKSNYEQFSKYKITFTKSGTDYVFDSIELLK